MTSDIDKKLNINLVVQEIDPNNDIESNTNSTSNSIHDVGETSNTDFDPVTGVKRGLKTRHLTLLSLAGIIGPQAIDCRYFKFS
ncbi:hypothetical protein B5S31_g5908 [[Candida] boidinii]|uniref:Unnamed protein product n=1 Tax=Candida boidinii TaxID=5477 RepID=A0ACB5UDP4_CANBO|nr:hypothetical protein B5S31_g5908 [[Candida] boidinii]GMF08975.1 unnamed protein product [[Candida] boidinii]